MEPAPESLMQNWMQVWNVLIAFGGPFSAFGGGVWIAHRLKLYSKTEGKDLALMSFPVGLLVLGTLIGSASISDPLGGNRPRLYGITESASKYMVFNGTVMFLGTSTPHLFEAYRKRFKSAK